MSAAAVVSATVAEPCATRSAAATRYAAKMTGMPRSDMESARASPMPEVRSTPPNMPPAPVIRMTEQMGPSEPSMSFSARSRSRGPRTAIAMSRVISSAMGVWPMKVRISAKVLVASMVPAAESVLTPVLQKMSSIGSSMTLMTFAGDATVAGSWSVCSPRRASLTLKVNFLPRNLPHK